MGVGELIEQIRSLYVTGLRDELAARCAVSVEPIVRGETGEEIRQGALKLPSRKK